MKTGDALTFVRHHGVVLLSARGPVPSLAEAIAKGPIRGSWWGHPRGREIFLAARAVEASPDVLVCRLIGGKVTYVHRRLWPALVKLADRFPADGLAKVWEEHTETGAHRAGRLAFPKWVPDEVLKEAGEMSTARAEELMAPCFKAGAEAGRVSRNVGSAEKPPERKSTQRRKRTR